LLSRPPNWTIRHGVLQNLWGVGPDKFRRLMWELIAAGYVERDIEQPRDGDNRFMPYDYVVRDIPSVTPCPGFPQRPFRSRKPDTGNKNESTNTDTNKSPPNPLYATANHAIANHATVDCGSVEAAEEADASLVDDVLSEYGRAARDHGCSFVYQGSKPFKAWRDFRGDDALPPFDVVTEGGVKRRGIWMVSLYPRSAPANGDDE